jgi:predicted unusual protein kinase regulating ubiquinone biosynthesis (AarF/ABC1/UbiB family)
MLQTRYLRIVVFFARLLLGLAFWEIILPKFGLGGLSERTRTQRLRKAARRMRSLAIKMGGVMIKVGQFLSSRVDVLPPEFTDELEGLQDEVPAERFDDLRKVAEAEFQKPLEAVFARIESQPVAAASIGQAHRAWLTKPSAGNEPVDEKNQVENDADLIQVIVKIQRPNIEKIVTTDLTALVRVGRWLNWYKPIRRRANISALLADFSKTLFEEMDYINEGKNAELFAQNFADRPRIIVPRVAWAFTTRRVLTLEDVSAIKITDYDAITAMNIDRAEVAQLLFKTYLQQIFIDQFFHADPHPGNLFVAPGRENGAAGRDWQLVYIDFGMMGRITPGQRAGLREMAIAITTQDAQRTIKAYQMLGFLLPDADIPLIERAGTQIFERFWGKSTQELRQISIQEVIDFTQQYKELLFELPFQLPDDLILLGRALSILSGMCASLDPEFNVWLSILPYAQELIQEQRSQEGNWEHWREELVQLEQRLIRLPGRLNNLLMQLEAGELATRNPQLNERISRLEGAVRRLPASILFSTAILSGTLIYIYSDQRFGGAIILIGILLSLWSLATRR